MFEYSEANPNVGATVEQNRSFENFAEPIGGGLGCFHPRVGRDCHGLFMEERQMGAKSNVDESAPNSKKRIELTVERLPDGEVSPYLTQELQIGDLLELRAANRGMVCLAS